MALLKKLKSLLGLDEKSQPESSRDVGVTVEKERQAVDSESTDVGSTEERTAAADDAPATSVEAEAGTTDDAAAGHEAVGESTDEATPTDESETEDATVPEAEELDQETTTEADATTDGPAAESDQSAAEPEEVPAAEDEVEAEPEEAPAADEPEADDSGPVQDIKGIGPAYADRLHDADVDSIADLAAADPGEIADQTDISETRVDEWVKRANARR